MINPAFHTLLTELGFYFFIAFIILFKLWDKILAVFVVILGYCLAYSQDISLSLHIFIPPFIAGMLFYFIKIKYKKSWMLYTLLAVNYFCTLTTGRVLVAMLNDYYKNPHALSVWTMSAIITFIYVLFYFTTIVKPVIKDSKLTRTLGEIAYPFYLFHLYFLFWYWYFSKTVQPDLLVLAILAVVLVVSWGINVWVEKPLSRLASHILYLVTGLFGKSKHERQYLPGDEPPPL
jgi:peptidoglycan/LPS O-acetylase OafA/YrhL